MQRCQSCGRTGAEEIEVEFKNGPTVVIFLCPEPEQPKCWALTLRLMMVRSKIKQVRV